MNERQAGRIKAAIYNNLMIANPIFDEHEAMIKASRDQYLKSKKIDGS
jgi:hypothetical protein